MPRSEASRERRREYSRQWHARHPEYRKQWLAANRERENERKRRWRAANPDKVREQKSRYKRRSRAIAPMPPIFSGHPLFDRARAICGPRPYFDRFNRWEDAMSTVVLALLEGCDPVLAHRRFLSDERRVEIMHGPIYPNVDIRDDGKVVYTSRSSNDHANWNER